MKVALCFERFTLLTLLRLLPMLTVFTLLKQLYEKKGWYAYKPSLTKGRVTLPKRINFWKCSKQTLTPPHFRKS